MYKKIQKYIEKNKLLGNEDSVIVGVSGGADSIALLHILLWLGYRCIIAHCNFHLRTEESNRDESFVRKLSSELKMPLQTVDFETEKFAKAEGISIEMAARKLRYEWFEKIRLEHQATAIAVGHHADDNIETLLLNLVRGTGIRGLSGIAPKNGHIIRPLLCCSRDEIELFVDENGINYITDSTNLSNDYQRNQIRNQVIPLLEKINPSVRQTLYDSIQRFKDTELIYEQAIDAFDHELVEKKDNIIRINIALLQKKPGINSVLYEILNPYGFHPSVIQQIADNLDQESGKSFFSADYRLIKDREYLIITAKEELQTQSYYISQNEIMTQEPIYLKFKLLEINSSFQISREAKKIQIDAAKLSYPLQLRRWQEGDSFYPFGMTNKKKVSDFFIDNKYSLLEKEASWLLLSNEEIVWIVGKRLDNRFRITDETREILEIELV